ncbi:MAG: hypothetical protein JNJ54_27870 [Myxococcaceae bacterium]|nr:hypothetical protein [Myxococcaceae bacterium]
MLALLTALSLTAAPAPPRNVYVGVYLSDVSDFDLKAGRFKADLTVWVKWQGDGAVPQVVYENAEVDSKDELGAEDEAGWHSVKWRVQGTFRGEFPVHDFPFDRQTLPITFGLDVTDGVLVPDLASSGMSPAFSVTGWQYEPYFHARSLERSYSSDLGSVAHEGASAKKGLTTYSVEVSRPFGPYLIKFALPLALILLVALLALFLPPERLDVRSAMGITGLLSCIAFHYTQADTLPAVTYLVAADKLFLAAYVFVTVTLVLSVLSFRLADGRLALAQRADRLGAWLLPVATITGLAWMVWGALAVDAEPEPTAPVNPHASQPLLRIAAATLDTMGGSLPQRRAALVTRRADGSRRADLVVEAPAMTNGLVRLMPDGGMRIRWRLRADATWSDGARITADDLLFSLAAQPDLLRTRVERVDDRTVDVTYGDRRAEWLMGFTVYPRSAAALGTDGGRDALNVAHNEGRLATSGPYAAGEYVQGKSLVLLRNERTVVMKPTFERVEVTAVAPLDAAKALLAGEVDVVPSLTPDAYEALRDAKGVRVLEQPGDLLWVLVPQLASPPWNTVEARRALLAALDRDALVKSLAPAPAQVASGWLPEPPRVVPAGPTLKDLGLTGAVVTLEVQTIKSKDATHAVLAQHLVDDLTTAGLEVKLVERGGTELRQAVTNGTVAGLALLSRDAAEAMRFMNVPGEAGRTGLDRPYGAHFDAVMVEKYARAKGSLYRERRRALELELQAAWFERLPMLPLVLTSRLAAVREGLEGPDWGEADSLFWNVSEWRFTGPP